MIVSSPQSVSLQCPSLVFTASEAQRFETAAKPLYKCEEQSSCPTADPTPAAGP
jgi:hypothetical protein